MKAGLHDRLRGSQRDRVAPDTGRMTGSSNYQQPSTIRGEAQWLVLLMFVIDCVRPAVVAGF